MSHLRPLPFGVAVYARLLRRCQVKASSPEPSSQSAAGTGIGAGTAVRVSPPFRGTSGLVPQLAAAA